MSYLMRTSAQFLGEQIDFKRESYLEGFIFANPLILANSQEAPENLIPVYIIGRQEMIKITSEKRGITDLTCLIWEPDLQKYEIWILEFKVYSNSLNDVKQLNNYLNATDLPNNDAYKAEILDKAIDMVGPDLIDPKAPFRGSLCAQTFSDEVLKSMLEENSDRSENEKLVALRISQFPANNDNFILVERLIGEEKSVTGGPRTYYDDIPKFNDFELEKELLNLLKTRRSNYPVRFKQLISLLEIFANNPDRTVKREELVTEWKKKDLPEQDQGISVSQLLGYKNSGALRQILDWEILTPGDIKDNYKLRNKKDANIIKNVIEKLRNL